MCWTSLKHKINVREVFFFSKTHVMETKFFQKKTKQNKQNISLSTSSNHNLIRILFLGQLFLDTEGLRLKVTSVVLQFKASFFFCYLFFNHIIPVCILGSCCTEIVTEQHPPQSSLWCSEPGGFLASLISPRIFLGVPKRAELGRTWFRPGIEKKNYRQHMYHHFPSSKPDDLTHSQTQSDDRELFLTDIFVFPHAYRSVVFPDRRKKKNPTE